MSRRIGLLVLFAASGCVSISALQTASTVPEHAVRFTVAPEFGSWSPPGANSSTPSATALELSARAGLSDSTDVGFKAGQMGGSIDIKTKMFDSPGVVLAIEPGLGFAHYSNIGGSNDSETLLNLFLASYVGFRAGSSEVVLGPKVILEHLWQSTNNSTDNTLMIFSGTAGIAFRVTERLMIMPELSLGTVVYNGSCNGANCTGGVAAQAALGFHFGG
jgi:hypothetical protein